MPSILILFSSTSAISLSLNIIESSSFFIKLFSSFVLIWYNKLLLIIFKLFSICLFFDSIKKELVFPTNVIGLKFIGKLVFKLLLTLYILFVNVNKELPFEEL